MTPKRILNRLIIAILLIGCSQDTAIRNPYLTEYGFRYSIDLNLPQFVLLNTIGNPVYIGSAGVGIRGVFIMNTGFGQFMAWEASCPNHPPNNCSTLQLDGQNVVCDCEGYSYTLFTGQLLNRPNDGKTYYDLLYYQTTSGGNTVVISN
jgi:nitrite reductase/ring-hydroxylating ferredoxin subunit